MYRKHSLWRYCLWPTNFMQHSTSEGTDSHSCDQEIPHLLWNLKVHYCVHYSPSFEPILRQVKPFNLISVLHVAILQEIYPLMNTLSLPSKLHVQSLLNGYCVTIACNPIRRVAANIFGVGYKDATLHCKMKHLQRSWNWVTKCEYKIRQGVISRTHKAYIPVCGGGTNLV